MTDADPANEWEAHVVAVSALLLAGDVQARVVHPGGGHGGIEVRSGKHRIIWGVNAADRWGWTMVKPDGSTQSSDTPLAWDASVEDVARSIATTRQLVDLPEL